VEHAVLRATPAVLPVVGFPLLLCHRSLFVGKLLLWGRLSSLRPAFQPALAPFTHRPLRHPMPSRVGADQRLRPLFSTSVSSVFSVVCFFRALRVLRGLFFSVSSVLLTHSFFTPRKDFCRHESELPARPQPPRLFGCGPAALWFRFLRVLCTTSP